MANCSTQTHGDVTVIKENELKKKLHSSIFHATMIRDNDSLAHRPVYRSTNMECVLAYFNIPFTICTNNAIDSSHRETCTTKTCHDLANRFDIAASTVSRIFQKWLDNMYSKVGFFITWPKREIVHQNLPFNFKSLYRNCCCIIDCSEIFIEMSASFSARSKTYSDYKNHNALIPDWNNTMWKYFLSYEVLGWSSVR